MATRKRSLHDVLNELRISHASIHDKKIYHRDYRHIGDYSRRKYGDMYAIFKVAGLSLPQDTVRKTRCPEKWTDNEIRTKLSTVTKELSTTSSNSLKESGHGGLVGAVKKRYGTWNAGLVALGYEVAYKTPEMEWTKEYAKEVILRALSEGTPPKHEGIVKHVSPSVIARLFGGIDGIKEYCGFCAVTDRPLVPVLKADVPRKHIPELLTAAGIEREIIRMWYVGMPMNYTYIRRNRQHVLTAVNKYIGSWRQALEGVGINYDTIMKGASTNTLSECGTEFESVFAEILTEIGYEYIREGEGMTNALGTPFTLKPDFILPNWTWVDCKLSEWTDISETVKRYSIENPREIVIVYLRGNNTRRKRGNKWKYEHVSVYQFTKEMPDDRRKYYESKLAKIAGKADEGAVAR